MVHEIEKSTLEMDFFIRDKDSLIPVEVKATDNVYEYVFE